MSEEYERCDKMKQIPTTTSDRSWTKADSEELKKLVANASLGPWYAFGDKGIEANLEAIAMCNLANDVDKDRDFIVAARTAVPRLLDHVDKLEAKNSKMRAIVDGGIEVLEGCIATLKAENAKLRKVVEAAKSVDENCAEGGKFPIQFCHVRLREALSALEKEGS